MKETCACWLASPASSATSTPAASPPPGPRHPAVRPALRRRRPALRPLYLPGLPRRQDAAHLPGHWQRHLLAAPPHRPRQIRRHHRPTLRRPPRHGHRLRRPSHRVPRLRPATRPARRALRPGGGRLPPPAPTRPSRPDLAARPHHRRRTPAQARRRPHPLLVTGASGQSPDWIAAHADGWLTYPGSSVVPAGPKVLGQKIQAWRDRIPDGGFRPHATNEWIDLVDDPAHPPTLLHGGFILQIGRHALIDLLSQWQTAGVNHVALGIQFSRRPAAEAIQELAEEVLPRFPSHEDVPPLDMDW